MNADILVKELGSRIGIELAFDADGICAFKADDMVIVLHNLNDYEIALVGDIGEPPLDGLESLYRTMLEANHLFGGTGGATISFDAERDSFALVKIFDTRPLDADTFIEAVSKFTSVLEVWTKLTANWRGTLDETQPGSSRPNDVIMV
ncbi:MAG: type III secretion system chaperone [Victivallales bacterium]|nr:type III secretion system chaperone [Victivallales bacterium]